MGRAGHLKKIMGEKKNLTLGRAGHPKKILSLGRAGHLKVKKLDFGKGRKDKGWTSEKSHGGEKKLDFGKGRTGKKT